VFFRATHGRAKPPFKHLFMHTISKKIQAWIPEQDIDSNALVQVQNISEMPFIFSHVAVMPDCHLGMGATVGSVIATKGAIIPAAVGVDIGCGMIAVRTPIKKEQLGDLKAMRIGIERRVPCIGRMPVRNSTIQETAIPKIEELKILAGNLAAEPEKFDKTWELQLGSLGGGNHFIEITLDEQDRVWAFLHSGSRGVGNKIATTFTKKAKQFCEKAFIPLKDPDLAYLIEGELDFKEYMANLIWAQRFAMLNRREMMDRVLQELAYDTGMIGENLELETINCHHNFTQKEYHFGSSVWLTRKGAIEAKVGQLGLIPGSMGTASYIVEGKGNRMSFNSSPHGAGRRFSRSEARKQFTMEDFDKAMVGVESRRDKSLLDEIPAAYKDIDDVMKNSEELVEIKHTLRQVLNVKGD